MERIVLYGIGRMARKLMKRLEEYRNRFEIVAITDSNKIHWGRREQDYLIISPEEALKCEWDYIVVATLDYYEEIRTNICNQFSLNPELIKNCTWLFSKLEGEFKTELSAVLIIKNEAQYIDEWIAFHYLMGVQHFYIYDNESSDGLKKILEGINKDIVTYISWPGKYQQVPAYNHAIENFKWETKYMCFIDTDEFLFSISGEKLYNVVADIETRYELLQAPAGKFFGGVGVNWRIYGPSGHESRPDGLVIENYTHRAINRADENAIVKTICNPRRVREACVHVPSYFEDYCEISEWGTCMAGRFYDGNCEKLRINHYYSRSLEDLQKKFEGGRADQDPEFPQTKEEMDNRIWQVLKNHNMVVDDILCKYADDIKKMINEKSLYSV